MSIRDAYSFGIHSFQSAVQAFDYIARIGVELGASDIHIDPLETHTRVRLRINGSMHDAPMVNADLHEEIISHLKILSGARTDLHIVPQDGRCGISVDGKRYDIRASFMPTFFGENAVLRILSGQTESSASFASLGFTAEHVIAIDNALKMSHGLILVTGPTGSGKTTTLHSCLSEKVCEDISIVTLEDPIEYHIRGARQIHVHQSHGVTFAEVLRSILRQDPDVVMVGEIRDEETAELAVHTALTGHLVLSTLHTNSAIETIMRLVDMGIDKRILASTIKLIVSQRLVRARGKNYDAKNSGEENSGARTVVAETLVIDNEVSRMIYDGSSPAEIQMHALQSGYRTIRDHANDLIEFCIAPEEEILRVLGS